MFSNKMGGTGIIIKKELVFLGVVFLSLVLAWTLYDNYKYFNYVQVVPSAHGVTGQSSASLAVRVGDSITFAIDAGGDIDFGTLTAGTKQTNTTRLKTTTNSGDGFNFTAAKWSYITSPQTTFYSRGKHSMTISDTAGGIDQFDGLGSNCTDGGGPSTWVNGSSTGFGLTVYSAGVSMNLPTSPKDTGCWGGHGNGQVGSAGNKYAWVVNSGASPSSIFSSVGFSNSAMYVSVGYSLDVTALQAATRYQAAIEYIATTNP